MNKYIASALLIALLCPNAFAGSDGLHTDGVMASFDRMLSHRLAVRVQSGGSERDTLREAFAANLWSGASAKARQPIADAWASPASGERPSRALIIDAAATSGQTPH